MKIQGVSRNCPKRLPRRLQSSTRTSHQRKNNGLTPEFSESKEPRFQGSNDDKLIPSEERGFFFSGNKRFFSSSQPGNHEGDVIVHTLVCNDCWRPASPSFGPPALCGGRAATELAGPCNRPNEPGKFPLRAVATLEGPSTIRVGLVHEFLRGPRSLVKANTNFFTRFAARLPFECEGYIEDSEGAGVFIFCPWQSPPR